MADPIIVSLGDLGDILTLSPVRIRQLVKAGTISAVGHGRYDLIASVKGYVRFLRDRAIDGQGPSGANRQRLFGARADIAEFEAKRLAGSMVPVDEVARGWVEIVTRFRQKALSIPTKIAPLVAVEAEPDACSEIIETAMHEALAELAETDANHDRKRGAAAGTKGGVRRRRAAAKAHRERVGGPGA